MSLLFCSSFSLCLLSKPTIYRIVFLTAYLSVYITDCAATDSTQIKLSNQIEYYIDAEQKRIDLLDGIENNTVELSDSNAAALTQRVYFILIDSIQRFIANSDFTQNSKKVYNEIVYKKLKSINSRNVLQTKRQEQLFRFILGEMNAVLHEQLFAYLASNTGMALSIIELFRDEPAAESFLIYASHIAPETVFSNYTSYSSKNYALHILEEGAKAAPVTIKRYFNPNDKIYLALQKSNDTAVKVILGLKEKFSRKSNAFALLDDIVMGITTPEQADEIGNDPQEYLRSMLKIRARKNPLGVHSLESELEIYSLKFVRVLNDLHNEKDELRFASIEKFSAEEVYTLIVYSEEEIFTSTFNGLFKRIMIKLGSESGFEFLNALGNNRFRTFIKMAAGFGKLPYFLQSMTKLHQQMLMINFASGLEKYYDLSQAVEVADAFGSISDSLVLKILRGTINLEFVRLSIENNNRGTAIYGLLSNLFVEKSISNSNWFNDIAEQYKMPKFDQVNNKTLFDGKGINRWLIYFYDDEDGEASFSTFIKTFADDNWNLIDSNTYITIKSKTGKPVHIYANKPKHEYDGQENLEKFFSEGNFEPNVMVHRGHSYYAYKTIEKIKENTQIFVLGSCGGYHSISSIVERSGDANIVSSKQIGTLFVNNPMLKLLAEDIRKGKDVSWQQLWERLEVAVRDNTKAYERFLDYIPPHKNLGAIFIKTYNRITEQD